MSQETILEEIERKFEEDDDEIGARIKGFCRSRLGIGQKAEAKFVAVKIEIVDISCISEKKSVQEMYQFMANFENE